MTLREKVEGLRETADPDPGYAASPDWWVGWDVGMQTVLALIPPGAVLIDEAALRSLEDAAVPAGAVLVTEETLAAAQHAVGDDCLDVPVDSCGAVRHRYSAAAILARIREAQG